MDKPYCFLDVDGVLNTVRPNDDTAHQFVTHNGFRICVSKDFKTNVERMMQHFDMVWLTTWEHLANREFSPYFGWDEWPVVEWATRHADGDRTCKLGALPSWLAEHGERPWVFIDDDAGYEPEWSKEPFEDKPHLIITPYYLDGLTKDQVDQAVGFALDLSSD